MAFPQLVNAGKYFASITATVTSFLAISFYTYLPIKGVATVYAFSWDIVMDWGLLRSWSKGSYGLRPPGKLMYPVPFYYFCAVTNLVLRFAWLIVAYLPTDTSAAHVVMLIGIAEGYRRG